MWKRGGSLIPHDRGSLSYPRPDPHPRSPWKSPHLTHTRPHPRFSDKEEVPGSSPGLWAPIEYWAICAG